jgi:hypothetical protein
LLAVAVLTRADAPAIRLSANVVVAKPIFASVRLAAEFCAIFIRSPQVSRHDG